jgi:hypothetical protein
MTELQAVDLRHSVRNYIDKEIELDTANILKDFIDDLSLLSGLNIQLVLNEPKAFDCQMAKYGRFKGVKNYIAFVGTRSKEVDEKIGYFGEKIVLKAQTLGLNTCWVALTYKKIKSAIKLEKGEKIIIVISLGYGVDNGKNRKSKNIKQVSNANSSSPKWFIDGVTCALKAPTALNQQQFYFELKDGVVYAKKGLGFYAQMDLGIAKYHFEIGANKDNFRWG